MQLRFCVPCLFGLEGLAADELRRLGLSEVAAENGRVYFSGDETAIAEANLNLRTGERVLIELGAFDAGSFDALFEGTKALPWELFIPKDAAFPVTGYSLNSKLASIPDCQKIIIRPWWSGSRAATGCSGSPRPGRPCRSASRS